jgi:hypothetical protein
MGRTQKRARYSARTSQGAPFFSIPKQQPRLAGVGTGGRAGSAFVAKAPRSAKGRQDLLVGLPPREPDFVLESAGRSQRADHSTDLYCDLRLRRAPSLLRAYSHHRSGTSLDPYCANAFPGNQPSIPSSASLDPYCIDAHHTRSRDEARSLATEPVVGNPENLGEAWRSLAPWRQKHAQP